MKKNAFNNKDKEFLENSLNISAWNELSDLDNIKWDTDMLQRYSDRLNWTEISRNPNIEWTLDRVTQFQHSINWDSFSEHIMSGKRYNDKNIDITILKEFKHKINWSLLSENAITLTEEIIEELAEYLDWESLIENRYLDWTKSDIYKYEKYLSSIATVQLLNSQFWNSIVSKETIILAGKVMSK